MKDKSREKERVPDCEKHEHLRERRIIIESSRNSLIESETPHLAKKFWLKLFAARSVAKKPEEKERERDIYLMPDDVFLFFIM